MKRMDDTILSTCSLGSSEEEVRRGTNSADDRRSAETTWSGDDNQPRGQPGGYVHGTYGRGKFLSR
jgi:hypothetical protein